VRYCAPEVLESGGSKGSFSGPSGGGGQGRGGQGVERSAEKKTSAMSPEEAADVYSFGCVVFEVLEQQVPWRGLSEAQIVAKVSMKQERPEFTKTDRQNEDLRALAARCWLTEPSKRPSFSDTLAALLSDEGSNSPKGSAM